MVGFKDDIHMATLIKSIRLSDRFFSSLILEYVLASYLSGVPFLPQREIERQKNLISFF